MADFGEKLSRVLREVAADAGRPGARSKLEDLKDRVARMHKRHAFRGGDLVTWKPGMKNRRFPEEGQPAIVMEVLPTPIFDPEKSEDAGTPYFREPLDIVLGSIGRGGDLVRFFYDSSRLMPFGKDRDASTGDDEEEGGDTSKVGRLRRAVRAYNVRTEFRPRDLVVWKRGLRNRQRPTYDELAVVMELVPEPFLRRDLEAGTQSFNEVLDMKVGVLEPDGDIVIIHVDSRRFRRL